MLCRRVHGLCSILPLLPTITYYCIFKITKKCLIKKSIGGISKKKKKKVLDVSQTHRINSSIFKLNTTIIKYLLIITLIICLLVPYKIQSE